MSDYSGLPEETFNALRQEFIDWLDSELHAIEQRVVEEATQDTTQARYIDILRMAHNVKGSGGAFGFPVISSIAHRLEDFMQITETDFENTKYSDSLLVFVDQIRAVAERPQELSEIQIRELMRKLPTAADYLETDANERSQGGVLKSSKEALVISPSKTISAIARTVFESLGHRVVGSKNGLEGLTTALTTRPDFILISTILHNISGADLTRALSAMKMMQHTKIILVSTLDKGHADLQNIPESVDIIHQAGNFPLELFRHIKELG